MSIVEDNVNVSKAQKKKKLVRRLVDMEITQNIAKAAVQSVRNLDLDECYLWALENEFEDDSVLDLARQFDEEAGFETNGNRINVVQSVVNDRSTLSLEEVIQRIQEDLDQTENEDNVGTTVKTVCERYLSGTAVTSMNNCMSVEHMGKFLSMLSETTQQASILDRVLPEHLNV
uniref:Uncharacterized protein n=2 Tax=Ciona intestinalis TaxID=7719 RepID=H2XPN8_CIOIN